MRVKLCEKYKTEREELCNKIIKILQLDTDNSFILYELDENTEKQNALLDMKQELQKYFACSGIAFFKTNADCKRPYLSIIRGILRNQGYSVISTDYNYKVDGIPKKSQKYIILRNN